MTKQNKKQRVFVTTGVTAPLKDGQTREVTLVAVVTTEDKVLYPRREKVELIRLKNGSRKVVSTITDTLRVTETIVSFGLAVTSLKDVKADKAAIIAYNKCLADPSTNPKPKPPVPVVTAENGIKIATGKALKENSALVTLPSYSKNFFTKSLITAMLEVKLKQIMEVPDSFIEVSPIKASIKPKIDVHKSTNKEDRVLVHHDH